MSPEVEIITEERFSPTPPPRVPSSDETCLCVTEVHNADDALAEEERGSSIEKRTMLRFQ